jgi:formylglycine-generating enzyme required for sulfatase activity
MAWTSTPIPAITANSQWEPTTQSFGDVVMVLVPPGCFQMGSTTGDSDERPVTKICFDKPFWIDQLEVSQAQFGAHGGKADTSAGFPGDNHPIENITWDEARNFCGARSGRLPTEAEWEFAARGPDNLIFPWGDTFVAENLVYNANSNGQTADVGSIPGGASWVGALDMSGNVWEWTSSKYQPYPFNPDDGREDTTNDSGDMRVVRGGSWYDDSKAARTSTRNGLDPQSTNGDVGVRCVRDY